MTERAGLTTAAARAEATLDGHRRERPANAEAAGGDEGFGEGPAGGVSGGPTGDVTGGGTDRA